MTTIDRRPPPTAAGAHRADAPAEEAPWPRVSPAVLGAVLASDRPRLLAVARRLLGDAHAAEDAVQEASVRALRAIGGFRGASSLGTWVHRILVNVCVEQLRRRRVAIVPLDGDALDPAPDPADAAATRVDVAASLAGLSPDHRTVVALVDVWGLDYGAAAAALGVPAGTVASRLARSRAILRAAQAGRAA